MISPEYPPYFVGGLGTHVQQLARGLARSGCEVYVLAANRDLDEVKLDGQVTVCFVRLPGQERKFPYEFTLFDIETLSGWIVHNAAQLFEPRGLPSLIHVHEWPGFAAAKVLRARWKVPVLTTIHAVYAELKRRSKFNIQLYTERYDQFIELERECCRGSDRLVAVSNSVRKDVAEIHSVPEDRIEVIFNGFDFAPFRLDRSEALTAIETERKRLLIDGESLIIFAGRLTPHKGLLALLRSAIQVIRQERKVRYLIVGDITANEYAEMLASIVNNHPLLRHRVVFEGKVPRERLGVLYQVAKVAVVPSLYEPFGYAATEAMAAGKPVVATDTGGLSEIIQHERSGLLIPMMSPGTNGVSDIDIRKLAEAQVRLLRDPILASRLGNEGQRRVEQEFGLDTMVESTLRSYDAVLGCQQL